MALACWMWALELLLESVESFSLQKLNLAAMCLGLSVVASLAFASPACALLSVFLVWFKNPRLSQASRLALPQICFLVAFILLVIPLNHADWKTLGVGASSLRQTINEMMALSLGTSTKGLASAIRVALSLAAVATACFALRYWRHREGALAVLTGATLPLTLALLLVAHRWLHTPFPQEGSIYLVPITVLSLATIILKRHSNTARSIFLAFSAVLLARYVGEIPFGMYQSGTQFAGGRLLAKTLRGYAGLGTVRIGVSLAAEPIMSYYRTRYRQGNWQPIDRQPLTAAYDYYVLTPDDAALVDQRHLHILYRDTGLTLAQ